MDQSGAAVDLWAPGDVTIHNNRIVRGSSPGVLSIYSMSNSLVLITLATASVAGLVAYFLASTGHSDKILEEWTKVNRDRDKFARVIKAYLVGKSYERLSGQAVKVNVAYNGEVPLRSKNKGDFACPNHPGFGKREDTPYNSMVCPLPSYSMTATKSQTASVKPIPVPSPTTSSRFSTTTTSSSTSTSTPKTTPKPKSKPGNATCTYLEHSIVREDPKMNYYTLLTDFLNTKDELATFEKKMKDGYKGVTDWEVNEKSSDIISEKYHFNGWRYTREINSKHPA